MYLAYTWNIQYLVHILASKLCVIIEDLWFPSMYGMTASLQLIIYDQSYLVITDDTTLLQIYE